MADYAIQAKAQDINTVGKFQSDLHNLLEVLSKTDVQVLPAGTAFKIYKTSGNLNTSSVGEKELIPDSDIKMGEAEIVEIALQKYRNMTSIESIAKKGYDIAVGGSNTAMLRDIQKGIRKSIYASLASGTGSATGKNFQGQIASGAAYISKKFEDEAATPVFFANPEDAYGYLGTHNVTLEQQFGLSYLANFMGIGNVVIDSNVPKGTVYATACENLEVLAADLKSINGMELTTDETGIVAVHNSAVYENAALQVVAYCGVTVKPLFLDRIVKVTIGG